MNRPLQCGALTPLWSGFPSEVIQDLANVPIKDSRSVNERTIPLIIKIIPTLLNEEEAKKISHLAYSVFHALKQIFEAGHRKDINHTNPKRRELA